MIQPRTILRWITNYIRNYNLFLPEEDDYDDDNDHLQDAKTILQYQTYATWSYVFLLSISLYILFYMALMRPESRTITTSPITLDLFEQLYIKHSTTLSCPCSKVAIPYNIFVSNLITFHPVCSSIFISEEWIRTLYLSDASRYGTLDFRTTANSQFKLLASFCLLSEKTISQNQLEFDNHQFVTIYLLRETEVQYRINSIVDFYRNNASIMIVSYLNYLKTTTQGNYLISALNTNSIIYTTVNKDHFAAYQKPTKVITSTENDSYLEVRAICGKENPISAADFFSVSNISHYSSHEEWSIIESNTTLIKGFYGACTPVEAILSSTLDCLYDIECLELLSDYFPELNRMSYNWSNYVLRSEKQNISVYNILTNLFINEWSTTLNYSKYFKECAPSSCTYRATNSTNFSFALTLFISLYGSLTLICRVIALVFIKIPLKWQSKNPNIESVSYVERMRMLNQSLLRLNLFKNKNKRSKSNIKQQRIITCVYLILFIGLFLVLIFFTSLSTEIVTRSVVNPSIDMYNNLQVLHSKTLRCSCINTTIPYEDFISLSPTLHQICSSEFIDPQWISLWEEFSSLWIPVDWRHRAHGYLRLLSNLCQLANRTRENAVSRFLLQSLVVSNVLTEFDFNLQMNATLHQFYHTTITYFDLLIEIASLFMHIDQPYMGSVVLFWNIHDENLHVTVASNETTGDEWLEIAFRLPQIVNVNSTMNTCVCANNPHCQSISAVYNNTYDSVLDSEYNILSVLPDFRRSCRTTESLFLSTLQCFYSNSNCLSNLLNITEIQIPGLCERHPLWCNIPSLVYDPTLHRFPPNTSISIIIKNMMIEQWNSSLSYDQYYHSCAPSHCTYSERVRSKTTIGILIVLLSMIGGLAATLHLLTPYLYKFIFHLPKLRRKKQSERKNGHQSWAERWKTKSKNSITFLFKTLVNLNVFLIRDFDNNIDQTIAQYLGRLATRLYIILLIISFVILILYTIIQPRTLTEVFDHPSFYQYKHMKSIYGDNLKCSCSVIASSYNHFIHIEPIFHQICSSSFVSNQWRIDLTNNLLSNFSTYARNDYRRFVSAHLQFLTGLCNLSIQTVKNSIEQVLSFLLVTTELLSEETFSQHLESLIEQNQPMTSNIFGRLFYLIRSINHGNAIISMYGTNFEYIVPWNDPRGMYAPTEALIYDEQCSCGLYSNCTTQANFIEINPLKLIPIQGLKIGCTPSESLLSSTLECFYNQTCLNLLQQYTNYVNSSNALPIMTSRFLMNTTISKFVDDLFVERWTTKINYSSYYEQCSPLLCSYAYIQNFNLLYTITLILGLEGGLTIVLQWICPTIVQILFKIYQYRKKRKYPIQQNSSINETSINVDNSSFQCSFKIIFICTLLLITITGLVIFSIFIAKLDIITSTTNDD
ncbi:unnamed protein product [Adineta ricciae]|uniref:Uncharacterized protein n=1 Tax=Adineta ricciae TaxID=249248 RepID=A0A814JMR1_ADIRI|nr:unnamed protein product [Adineta ricciae]